MDFSNIKHPRVGEPNHFVDGKKNGDWVEQHANGGEVENPYVDGKMHGEWIFRLACGSEFSLTYRNGEPVVSDAVVSDVLGLLKDLLKDSSME